VATTVPFESIDTPVELGRLLAGTLGAVARAQSELDAATAERVEAYRQRDPATFAVPPLWHVFSNVEVSIALSVSVAQTRVEGVLEPRILSRTVNSSSVALYGYSATAGLAVRVVMQPLGAVPGLNGAATEGRVTHG
jgi:hypothetical protein